MEAKTKKKAKNIAWVVAYMVVIIALVLCGSFIFMKNYFSICYVDGQSMYPTFNSRGSMDDHPVNHTYDLTLFDEHQNAIDSIQRFDIVTAHYVGHDKSTDTVIKRVLGLPNETVKLSYDNSDRKFYLFVKNNDEFEFKKLSLPFDNTLSYQFEGYVMPEFNNKELKLGSNEYALKGDNYSGNSSRSYDSFTGAGLVPKYNLHGKYIALIGYCGQNAQNPHYFFPRFYHV